MTIEVEFLELMTQTVTIAPFSSNNAYGEPSFGTAVSYSARVVNKPKMIRNAQGKEVVSMAQTWLYGSPTVTPDDRITLPDGTQPPILYVAQYPDENGAHHEVVYTGGGGYE